MSTLYDKNNKLWSRLSRKPMGETKIALGRKFLDLLLLHGSKICQVKFLTFRLNESMKIIRNLFRSMTIMVVK